MKTYFTLLLTTLLSLTAAGAYAQSLPHGVSVAGVTATQHADGQWVVTSQVSNHRDSAIARLSVVYALYDANGKEVGRASSQRDTPLGPGAMWQADAATTTAFTRVSAKEIKELSDRP